MSGLESVQERCVGLGEEGQALRIGAAAAAVAVVIEALRSL